MLTRRSRMICDKECEWQFINLNDFHADKLLRDKPKENIIMSVKPSLQNLRTEI